jgi:hypothetical protein
LPPSSSDIVAFMAGERLSVAYQGADTIVRVHQWPWPGHRTRICSSVCAELEGVNLAPQWERDGDAAAVGQRLAPSTPKGRSGKDKGRVLYAIERQPITSGDRVAGCALISFGKAKRLAVYRICVSTEVVSADRSLIAVDLVNCARSVAEERGAQLRMLLPPNAQAGDLCSVHGFSETETDHTGQVWLV